MLVHNSVIDHNGVDILHNNILNEVTMRVSTGLYNSKIFRHEYIMQLNNAVDMTILQTKFIVI